MSWLASILISLLAAVVGTVSAGYVASLAVDWYRVSSFEGKSGFMVIGVALIGAAASFVVALVVCRVVAARPDPGVTTALLLSNGLVLALAVTAATAARLLADVPPKIAGEELMLVLEVRFPRGQALPAGEADREWAVRLSSAGGGRVRTSKTGPLWTEDARQEDGRWIVAGAVEVFTSRGSRVIDLEPEGLVDHGFIVPLSAFPGRSFLEWSDWLPHARAGEPALPEGVRYRFKVVPRSQSVRTEKVGPFDIATVARSFSFLGGAVGASPYQADADFLLQYRGKPVTLAATPPSPVVGGGNAAAATPAPAASGSSPATSHRAAAVWVLPGAPAALLAYALDGYDSGRCYLLVDDDGRLRIEEVTTGSRTLDVFRLTSDAETFARARSRTTLVGRVDRRLFGEGGLYLVSGAIVDATRRSVRRFSASPQGPVRMDLPPLLLSPDERSFARIGFDRESPETRVLHVIDTVRDEVYAVPIDMMRTRLATIDAADAAWAAHYFTWERGADGVDHLVPRADVKPLPFHGLLTQDADGYREYRIHLAGPAVAEALLDFLKTEFQAESATKLEYSTGYEVRVAGRVVNVMVREDERIVSVWMERGTDTTLVADIATRFDEALATGKNDDRFGR